MSREAGGGVRPLLYDVFCGAGGASVGYQRAGFDVVGIDHVRQKNYPFQFIQMDAFEFFARVQRGEFPQPAAWHCSPPCQAYANVTRWRGVPGNHPDLAAATRNALTNTGQPWVIENVVGAPIRPDLVLCGSHFGLRVRRHRWFETSWGAGPMAPATCAHGGLLPFMHKGERAYADAMGCEWMNTTEAREAIPPAFTHWIGSQLIQAVQP